MSPEHAALDGAAAGGAWGSRPGRDGRPALARFLPPLAVALTPPPPRPPPLPTQLGPWRRRRVRGSALAAAAFDASGASDPDGDGPSTSGSDGSSSGGGQARHATHRGAGGRLARGDWCSDGLGSGTSRGASPEGRAASSGAAPQRPAAERHQRHGWGTPLDDRAFTSVIKKSRSWQALDRLLQRQAALGRHPNALHASAALTHLAQLLAAGAPAADAGAGADAALAAFAARLVECADGLLPGCDARGLANILWATARLRQLGALPPAAPGRAWLGRWVGAAERRLEEFDAQQLATVLWALAALEAGTGGGGGVSGREERLAAAVAARLAAPATAAELSPQGAANAAWALGRLGVEPPGGAGAWCDALLAAAVARGAGSSSGGGGGQLAAWGDQALCNVLGAYARAEHVPSAAFLAAAADQLRQLTATAEPLADPQPQQQQRRLRPQALAMSLWALARLRRAERAARPAGGAGGERAAMLGECFGLLLAATRGRMRELSHSELAISVWAAGESSEQQQLDQQQQHQSGQQQLEQEQQQEQQEGAAAQQWLEVVGGAEWQQELWQQLLARAAGLDAHAAYALLLGCARLGLAPPAPALEALLAAQAGALQAAPPRALTGTVSALVRLGYRPYAPWLQGWLSEVARRRFGGGAAPGLALEALSALAALRFPPPDEWLAALLAATAPRLHALPPRQLAGLGCALAALRARPDDAWAAAFRGAAAARGDEWAAPELARVLWTLARLSGGRGGSGGALAAAGGGGAVGVLLGRAARLAGAGAAPPQWLAVTASAAARLQPGGADAAATVAACCAAAAAQRLDARELASLLHAAAVARAEVPTDAQRALTARAAELAGARELEPGHWGLVAWALARLARQPAGRWRVGRSLMRRLCVGSGLAAAAWQPRPLPGALEQQQQAQQQSQPQAPAWQRAAAGEPWRVREACRLLWAAAVTRHAPSSAFLRLWQLRAAGAARLFSGADLVSSTWALGAITQARLAAGQRAPWNWRWQRAWAAATGPRLGALAPRELALLLWGAGAAGAAPPRPWLARAAGVAAGHLKRRAWRGGEAAMAVWGLARLRAIPVLDPEAVELLLAQLTAATLYELPALPPRSLLQLLAAAAALDPRLRSPAQLAAWRRAQSASRLARRTAAGGGSGSSSGGVRRRSLGGSGASSSGEGAAASVDSAASSVDGVGFNGAGAGGVLSGDVVAARLASAAAASAAARAEARPSIDPRWLAAWLAASARGLESWAPAQVAEALAALARARCAPPPQWQRRAVGALVAARREGRLAPRDAAAAAWALRALGSPLEAELRAACRVAYAPAAPGGGDAEGEAGAAKGRGGGFARVAGPAFRVAGAPGAAWGARAPARVRVWRHGHGVASRQLQRWQRRAAQAPSPRGSVDGDAGAAAAPAAAPPAADVAAPLNGAVPVNGRTRHAGAPATAPPRQQQAAPAAARLNGAAPPPLLPPAAATVVYLDATRAGFAAASARPPQLAGWRARGGAAPGAAAAQP
jgi:hypothetical protein